MSYHPLTQFQQALEKVIDDAWPHAIKTGVRLHNGKIRRYYKSMHLTTVGRRFRLLMRLRQRRYGR